MTRKFQSVLTSMKVLALLGLMFGLMGSALPARAGLAYFGGNLAWSQYGRTFTTAYNSGTMGTYLTEFKNDHLNYVRVWVCEGLDGLTFDGNGNCTGISSQLLSNVQNFAGQANGKGICVEFVFLNYMDIQSYPNMLTNSSNMSNLISKALVPLGKAIQGYNARIDLINEGNVATNKVSWGNLRSFISTSLTALHNNGVNRWVTMSDQYSADYTSYFTSTVGGLGLNFYEYHDYNGDGSVPVSNANVGYAPLDMNEFGPGNGWNNNSYTSNKNVLGQFLNNAQNKGYEAAAFWCYINDGNFQLRGTTLMGDMSWWGATFGH